MEREQTNKLDQNSEDEVREGPGPPNDPGTAVENKIYQWIEGLRDDIDQIIEAYNAADTQEEETSPDIEVEDWTVSKICDELKNGRFKNIVVFTGAGISTASGIPDFRTPGTGLYDNLQAYDLDEPEDIFDIFFFRQNPKPFYTLAKEIMPGKFAPTITHHFIAMLEEKGILSQYFTQNIDGLDKLAGISDEKLVQVHGSFDSNHCCVCEQSVSQDLVNEAMLDGEPLECPHCTINGDTNWIKPDITFFGEALPEKYSKAMSSDVLEECDLLIIIGTSLKVGPSNMIPHWVPKNCPRLLINREPTDGKFQWIEDQERSSTPTPSRDAFLKSDADVGSLRLAEALGIKKELEERFIEKSKDIQYS